MELKKKGMGRASEQMEGKDPEKDEDKHLWKHWALLIASSDDHSFLQKTLLSFSGNQMENIWNFKFSNQTGFRMCSLLYKYSILHPQIFAIKHVLAV